MIPREDTGVSAMNADTSDSALTKSDLRKRCKRYRKSLTDEEYARRSLLISDAVHGVPEIAGARVVHVYWPIIETREVDTRPLIARFEADGKTVVLPVVDTDVGSSADPQLSHVRFPGEQALVRNRWGILEPPGGESVPLGAIDVVIVPALGVGRNGHRVGYGMGFYDAFLSRLDVPAVCPVFGACLVDFIPAEAHDRPIDVAVTEDEVIAFSRM